MRCLIDLHVSLLALVREKARWKSMEGKLNRWLKIFTEYLVEQQELPGRRRNPRRLRDAGSGEVGRRRARRWDKRRRYAVTQTLFRKDSNERDL